jgi:hypothetical protein
MFCPAEGRLSVDDPLLTEELMEETMEAIGLSETDERAVELEFVLVRIYSSDGTGTLGKQSVVKYQSLLTHKFPLTVFATFRRYRARCPRSSPASNPSSQSPRPPRRHPHAIPRRSEVSC